MSSSLQEKPLNIDGNINQGVSIGLALTSNPDVVGVELCEENVRFSLRIFDGEAFNNFGDLDFPRNIGGSVLTDSGKVFCLGPDEWMIIDDVSKKNQYDELIKTASGTLSCSIVDISHRNIGLRVSGPQVEAFLNGSCPLDLSLKSFPVGKCTRTVFANAEIILCRQKEFEFYVECWRSFAPYIVALMEKTIVELV